MEADAYLQKLASYIRDNAKRLGAPPFGRPTSTSLFSPTQLKPLSLRLTPRNLYYILLRFQAIGLDVGSLEVKIEVDARRAISLIEPLASSHGGSDRSETGSFRSMASSAVSSLGLGGWWGASNNDPDTTLKLIYSAFTKLPSLVVHAARPEDETILEMESTGPLDFCVPLKVFRNLQLLEIHSLPPAVLLVPSSPFLRSVILRDLESPATDDEGQWLVPVLFSGCMDAKRPRRDVKVKRTKQPSASASVMQDLDETDEEDTCMDERSTPGVFTPVHTIARFSNLTHLALSHLSLVTLPPLPLPSVVSLDLSHNLLLELPSNLIQLPSLRSLNLEDNMILSLRTAEAVLPTPSLAPRPSSTPSRRLRTATGLQVLNLDHNRISNLHGLSTIVTLERLSIRHNHLSESQELTRLAALPNLVDLFVSPNPYTSLSNEEDWRVRLWEAWASEGKAEEDCPRVDNEPVRWNERRKMKVPFPTTSGLKQPAASVPRNPDVVPVGAPRSRAASPAPPIPADVFQSMTASRPPPSAYQAPAVPARPTPSPSPAHNRRRKQRVVDLDGSSTGASREDVVDKMTTPGRPVEVDTTVPIGLQTTSHSSLKIATPSKKSSASRRALSSSLYIPGEAEASSTSPAKDAGDEFRLRLEGLRADVGDSWLRVLSAGGAREGSTAGAEESVPENGSSEEREAAGGEEQEAPAEVPVGPVVTKVKKKNGKKKKRT